MPSAKNTGDAKVGRSEEKILDILMFKFDVQIISHLDKRAKEAILKQEEIEEERVFAKVKGAIEGRVLDLLLESLTSAPKLKIFTEIVRIWQQTILKSTTKIQQHKLTVLKSKNSHQEDPVA